MPDSFVPDSKGTERRICELLDMDDEELLAELDRYFLRSDECHQKISDDLEEMILEVDRLISRLEEMECQPREDEDVEPFPR